MPWGHRTVNREHALTTRRNWKQSEGIREVCSAGVADLIVCQGQSRRFESDTRIAGWVEVHGSLEIDGDLTCLGLSIEPGGSVRCGQLVANVIEIDGLRDPARLEATAVRARFVTLVQTINEVIDNGAVDYVHHFAGDLNPSFDYERGDRIVPAEQEEDEEGQPHGPIQFDIGAIRSALCSGKNPFVRMQPIVTAAAAKPAPVAADPLADEVAAWCAQHPGPQRAMFDELRATWSDRLRGGGVAIERAIKKAVGSPKLAGPRDAWIAELGLAKTAKTAEPVVGRDALTVRVDPPKKSWLARIPEDSESIDADGQRIETIPPDIARYTRATRVQLSYNKIARIPPELCQLPIENLDLRGNQLTSLPDEIRQLTRLTSLVLEDNPITTLPDALCELTQLAELSLQNVPITKLPDDIGGLTSLTFLSLQGCNKLARLPESFFTLTNLTTINLHYTRLAGADLARLRTTFPSSVFGNYF